LVRYTRKKKRKIAQVTLVFLILFGTGVFTYMVPLGGYRNLVNRTHFSARLALVKPVFTAAAYKSFYTFYAFYTHVRENESVTRNLDLLQSRVDPNDLGKSKDLLLFFNFLPADRITIRNYTMILSDIDINNGGLFAPDGSRRFDTVILGFTEYVTQKEYDDYKHFVETGGKMLALDANNFLAEVRYDPVRDEITLVKGHGWEFNGTAARRGIWGRWAAENTNWLGSNLGLHDGRKYRVNGAIANTTHPLSILMRENFGKRIFEFYKGHEENVITNSSDNVIAYWDITGLKVNVGTVAVYEHDYRKGMVIHTGIFGSDIMADPEMQFFLQAAIGVPPSDIVLLPTEGPSATATATQNVLGVSDRDYILLLVAVIVILVGANTYLLWVIRKRNR
jgi:hypothetical protein